MWSLDPARQAWRNLRPLPEPVVAPLRCASWDADQHVVVVFGGEGSTEGTLVYDPYDNTWTRKRPKVQPPFRSGGNMVYDARRKRHILFGAQFTDDPHTWAYHLAENEWIDLKPKVQPPTRANDAVMAYDAGNDVIVASVKNGANAQGSYETWVFDGTANTWKHMMPREAPPGLGNRRRIMAYVPDLNVIVMEDYVNPVQRVAGTDREQQLWTYRYAEVNGGAKLAAKEPVRTRPPLVEGVVASVLGPRQVMVTWRPSRSAGLVGYHVERAVVDVFSEDELVRLRKDTPPLAEPSVGGKTTSRAHRLPFSALTETPLARARGLQGCRARPDQGCAPGRQPPFAASLRQGADRGERQEIPLCRLCLPGAGRQRPGRGKRPQPLRADDSVRARTPLLQGGRR